jgi:hypothetical protein
MIFVSLLGALGLVQFHQYIPDGFQGLVGIGLGAIALIISFVLDDMLEG